MQCSYNSYLKKNSIEEGIVNLPSIGNQILPADAVAVATAVDAAVGAVEKREKTKTQQ